MSDAPLRIVVVGATGRTGNAVVHALGAQSGVELVACVAPSVAAQPTRALPVGVPAFARLDDVDVDADVLVDLGVAEAVPSHARIALNRGWHAIVGATGFDEAEVQTAGDDFAAAGLGLLVVPNFSIGAVLMMQFAARAAQYLPDAAIVETHHATKVDAPSGTALRTAHMIAEARSAAAAVNDSAPIFVAQRSNLTPYMAGAHGMDVEGVPVHALRLAGATAHQDVKFSGTGEVLTITHDAIDRSCYAAGVALAARQVAQSTGLTIGLEL